MLQYHTRLLLPQLIPHSRLQGGWSFIQIKCLSLFCGVFLFQIPKDVLPFFRPGCWRQLKSCGLPREWRVDQGTSPTAWASLQSTTGHVDEADDDALEYKRGNADQDRPRVSRLERKSSEGGLVGRWRGNFFPSCLHLVLSSSWGGEEVIFSSSCPDKWSPKCRPWTGQRWSAPQPGILKVRPQGDEKTLHRT